MNHGRVEMYYEGEWGTVCDENWNIRHTTVACRQLGYSTSFLSYQHRHYGVGSGPIFSIDCDGSEGSLFNCTITKASICNHHQDVAIICRKYTNLKIQHAK